MLALKLVPSLKLRRHANSISVAEPKSHFFRAIIIPSRIGSRMFSTRGSCWINSLNSFSNCVSLSIFPSVCTTFPDHKTLSEKMYPPGYTMSKTR